MFAHNFSHLQLPLRYNFPALPMEMILKVQYFHTLHLLDKLEKYLMADNAYPIQTCVSLHFQKEFAVAVSNTMEYLPAEFCIAYRCLKIYGPIFYSHQKFLKLFPANYFLYNNQ